MNKIFKLILLYFTLIFFVFGLTGCSSEDEEKATLLNKINERGKLIVGVKLDSKPFGYLDENEKLQGFDVDLSREIAKRLLGDENAVEFKQVTASNRIFSLTSGAIDMIAATMTITPQRMEVVSFSEPYYVAGQAIMVPKSSGIRTAKDLNGKRVVIVLGTTSENNIRLLAPQAVIQGFRTYTSGYTAMKSGRADAMTTDDTILKGFIMDDTSMQILKKRYTQEPYGVAFRREEESKSLENAVNIILQEMKADGTLNRLKRKWMKD